MRFIELPLAGAFLIELEPQLDERGAFTRTFCRDEFEQQELCIDVVQCSVSRNDRVGTLRGLHFQASPAAETKLVRCSRGSIFDVIVDLRSGSPTFGEWTSAVLSAENGRMLYVPAGFAHGFQTLEDYSEVTYQISAPYSPDLSRGIRWDDPDLRITWPLADPILSLRDRTLPIFRELKALRAA